jgi:hypothetical protein
VAVLDSLINLFPGVAASLQFVKDLAVLSLAVALTGMGLAWLKRAQLRQAVALEARGRGLSDLTASFLADLLWREGPDSTRDLLRSTDSIRSRLARELASLRQFESATRFAEQAAELMKEMRVREPAFEGAPLLFEKVSLSGEPDSDGAADAPGLTAFVVEIDEGNLHLASTVSCPWQVRQELHLTRTEKRAESLVTTLKLRPMPGNREWVVSLDFQINGLDRRCATRRGCRIEAWTLPTTAGAYTLRGRLQGGEALHSETLEKLEAWPRRQPAVIEDFSCDGARLVVEHEGRKGDHFYLVLTTTDGSLAALPLVEVVSARSEEDGRSVLSTRFCAVRLKERNILADYAQNTATLSEAPSPS